MPKFTTKFDAIYERHAPGVPVEYLRALAAFESNSNPASTPTHDHWGLLQVGRKPLADYNAAKGTHHSLVDVLNPTLNVKIWFEYYQRTGVVFDRLVTELGVRGVNFQRDWKNPEYALMVTAAWNSGIGAVQKAARMKPRILAPTSEFIKPVTHASMFALARRDGNTKMKKLFRLKKETFQREVVGAFLGLEQRKGDTTPGAPGGSPWILLLLLFLASKN